MSKESIARIIFALIVLGLTIGVDSMVFRDIKDIKLEFKNDIKLIIVLFGVNLVIIVVMLGVLL